jgi:hypothetical protein
MAVAPKAAGLDGGTAAAKSSSAVSAIGQATPGATMARQMSYQSVTVNAPAAIPKPQAVSPQGMTPLTVKQQVQTERPVNGGGASGLTKTKAAVATGVVAGAAIGAAAASNRSTKANPTVSLGGMESGMQSRLAPAVSGFQDRYRNVEVRHQPTTSGWTWLFLAWALSNSGENHRLEAENKAMKERMATLEKELRQEPAQWEQVQSLAQGRSGEDEGTEEASEEAREGVTGQSASGVPQDDMTSARPLENMDAIAKPLADTMMVIVTIGGMLGALWMGFRMAFTPGYD